ncbi:carboxypeptidase-like regulatory domain-containing protein [Bradyrhizobium sp.]|uniref:carboxypeptidase-like regulatory domain-containing protein n=1 Tax=Bradyrhizobium sp. TaxID=376 RepID=UPI002D49DBEF|nr:carboxypeptidase-like regulatory domain-containing protein [Bradyrhizobium sp.]HZR73050.1 carboxypeptidase-like regulatory domain-containing protein [Bradyrhizobium sp.]
MLAALSIGAAKAQSVSVGAKDIGGIVTGPRGPEAGVWVIAETYDLGTRFARIVVTDDSGRYLVPDLPQANYNVWVRGYGLVDSAKVAAVPGKTVNLNAIIAPDAATAAKIYPAIYWYAMLKLPAKDELPPKMTIGSYLNDIKSNGCIGCHQIGNLATRTIPKEIGAVKSSEEAWIRRVSSGQAGADMVNALTGRLQSVPIRYLADWTDRIAAGEVPDTKPPRPQGIERNVVVTVRDWLDDKHYLHDLSGTDRRTPTVNANGPLYGATELSTDKMPILDPVKNEATTFTLPVRDADTPSAAKTPPAQPSPYWGDEHIWDSKANVHNPMLDDKGRLWLTARVRGADDPAFCKEGSDHASAKLFPLEKSGRQLAMFDPKTKKYTFVDTCFSTHHLQFAYNDGNNTLFTSGDREVVGWLNTKMFEKTGDAAKSQGWTAFILDTNGNGRRDDYVEPGAPPDPTKDRRVSVGFYAVMPSPVEPSVVWGSHRGYPGSVVRVNLGANPPQTALTEVYNVPAPGFGVRGADIDRNGVVWVSLASGHLASFDRRKCKGPLNGPAATGSQCPEGWSFHQFPGPGFKGIGENSAESSYYTWVDQWNTSGLGNNVPVATGNLSDGLLAWVGDKFVTLRVPYPLGFYAKGLEGRIDDPGAGWKGRGLWATSGDRTPWHHEGGKGNKPLLVHFQMRPDPLAH